MAHLNTAFEIIRQNHRVRSKLYQYSNTPVYVKNAFLEIITYNETTYNGAKNQWEIRGCVPSLNKNQWSNQTKFDICFQNSCINTFLGWKYLHVNLHSVYMYYSNNLCSLHSWTEGTLHKSLHRSRNYPQGIGRIVPQANTVLRRIHLRRWMEEVDNLCLTICLPSFFEELCVRNNGILHFTNNVLASLHIRINIEGHIQGSLIGVHKLWNCCCAETFLSFGLFHFIALFIGHLSANRKRQWHTKKNVTF